LCQIAQLDLKCLYKDPQGILSRRRRINTKKETEAVPVKIGGGKHCWSHPGRFFDLSDITNTAIMMKRE
jgi:hypothetical protein